jgi:hypothetical protein
VPSEVTRRTYQSRSNKVLTSFGLILKNFVALPGKDKKDKKDGEDWVCGEVQMFCGHSCVNPAAALAGSIGQSFRELVYAPNLFASPGLQGLPAPRFSETLPLYFLSTREP